MRFQICAFCIVATSIAGCSGDGLETDQPIKEQGKTGEFRNLFGTPDADVGYAIIQTRDGGFIISGDGDGTIAPADGTISRPMVTKLDKRGKVVWSTFLRDDKDYLRVVSVLETLSNEYLVMFMRSDRLTLVKIDGAGRIVRNKFYEKSASYVQGDHLIQATGDGGCILAGEPVGGEFARGTYLVKLGATGLKVWSKQFDRSHGSARSLLATADNGFIIAGDIDRESNNFYDANITVLKTDSRGELLWSKTYGDSTRSERANSIAATPDGGYVIAGQIRSDATYEALLMKIDAQGNMQWLSTFGTEAYAAANSVISANDGCLFAGNSGGDIFVGKADLQGALVWSKKINPFSKQGWANSIIRANAGEYAVTGSYGEGGGFGGGEYDVFLLIVDNDGNF